MMDGDGVLPESTRIRHELFGAWCAPIFTVLTVVGWLGIAHFIAPAKGSASAPQVAHWFLVEHRTGVLWGCSIFLASTCFLAIWTAQLGIMLWRLSPRAPLMAVVQILAGAAIVVIVIINCSLWLGAAYRRGASPDVVRALNDSAWLGFLIAWPVLSMQMLATASVTVHDRRPAPLIPRWLSWASAVGAVLLFTAGGAAFAHGGPFAFSGVLGFYLPVVIWALWFDSHALYMRREIRVRQRELAGVLVGAASP